MCAVLVISLVGGLLVDELPPAPAVASQGMVAAAHPWAVEAGLAMLKSGGNAVDAALAVNAVLTVVEPMSCGPGGDLFAIVWDAQSNQLHGLNASGRAPLKATRQFFAERGLKEIPELGPLSWSVPGCVDGWEQLRAKFGTKTMAEILAPAIHAAETGFEVTPVIGRAWQNSVRILQRDSEAAKTFLLPNGRAPEIGSMMKNPRMAEFLKRIAQDGAADFYHGKIAEELVDVSNKHGGLFSERDFSEHRSTWVQPISTRYRGHDVFQLPPNGQGLAVLQMLNVLELFDVKKLGHNSPEFIHLFVEAKKLAYSDRAAFYADPEFERGLPWAELASKEYGKRQRLRIDMTKAALDVPPGDPKLGASETTYLCVVDRHRNAVSLIQSTYFGWGSGIAAGKLGFMLQNRGTLFALDEKHANRLEPGKRPFHTIIPGMVLKAGKPWFCFGVMGGDMQPQGQVQVLVNLIDHGMNPQAAGAAPRVRHDGSSTPTGRKMTDGGTVVLERAIPASTAKELAARGHRVTRGPASGFGGYQGILIDAKPGTLLGGSEPRKDGLAKGY